eukprot:Clim_evm100s153 gene=Clim_evmTU100s153
MPAIGGDGPGWGFFGLTLTPGVKYTQYVTQAFTISSVVVHNPKRDATKCKGSIQIWANVNNIKVPVAHFQASALQGNAAFTADIGDKVEFEIIGPAEIDVDITGKYISASLRDQTAMSDDDSDDDLDYYANRENGGEGDAEEHAIANSKSQKDLEALMDERDMSMRKPRSSSKKAMEKVLMAEEDDDSDEEDDEEFEADIRDVYNDDSEDDDDDDSDDATDDDEEEDSDEETSKPASTARNPRQYQQMKKGSPANEHHSPMQAIKAFQNSKKETPLKPTETKQQERKQEPPESKAMRLKGGTIAKDLRIGKGALVRRGQNVSVYYKGTLQKNGKMFDSCTSGKPFKFRLGGGEVIKGWDIGVEGMRVGGKRHLTIPAHQAYGHRGAPPVIPPNATLCFEVDLMGSR